MINNRQAGRRRGRTNNPRQSGSGGQNRGNGDSGNRIDNRARGNATQLLEKYRNMARDAQMMGDRVNAEYYLQFADHYFRVLADNRARQEEQQGQQGQQGRFRRPDEQDQDEEFAGNDDGFGNPGEGVSGFDPQRGQSYGGYTGQRSEPRAAEAGNGEAAQAPAEPSRDDQRSDTQRSDAQRNDIQRNDVQRAELPSRERAPRPPRRPRREPVAESVASEPEPASFDAAILPPSIGRPADSADQGSDEPAPRRTRRARPSAQAAE